MSNPKLDIETLILVKSFDLLKEREKTISISFEEMFDNNKLAERLSNKTCLSSDEKFLLNVIKMANSCKYTDKKLYNRCSAIIESLVTLSLDSEGTSTVVDNKGD